MRKSVPTPTSLSASMMPSNCVTMPYTVDSPSPVAWSASLVLKNGSKMRSSVCGSMPHPVSRTVNRIHQLGGVSASVWRRTLAVSIVNVPPEGIASCALTTRLRSACSS